MTIPVRLYPGALSKVAVGGVAVTALYGPIDLGGRISNPVDAFDQGIGAAESLFVSFTGPAGLAASGTTFELAPGDSLLIPPGTTSNISVNAGTSGHRFSAYGSSAVVPYVPSTGGFPPEGPTTVTKVIPAYIYVEYNDDEDCTAFFSSLNGLTQEDVDWFVDTALPIYTGLSGGLLDWVGAGLYGLFRPALPSGMNHDVGPLNTWAPNFITLNTIELVGNQNYYATSDDTYKRILTWHFWKGDGKVFDIRWLKRRVMRFLTGVNGTAGQTDDTSLVSVSFGLNNQVNISIGLGTRRVVGGSMPNVFGLNTFGFVRLSRAEGPLNTELLNVKPPNFFEHIDDPVPPSSGGDAAAFGIPLNSVRTVFTSGQSLPEAAILKAAIESGVCELPFQFTYVVLISH